MFVDFTETENKEENNIKAQFKYEDIRKNKGDYNSYIKILKKK